MTEPLWKVLETAYFKGRSPGFAKGPGYAAEIRALRDWLIPNLKAPGPKATDDAYAIWEERKALYVLLTTEAERAEKQL